MHHCLPVIACHPFYTLVVSSIYHIQSYVYHIPTAKSERVGVKGASKTNGTRSQVMLTRRLRFVSLVRWTVGEAWAIGIREVEVGRKCRLAKTTPPCSQSRAWGVRCIGCMQLSRHRLGCRAKTYRRPRVEPSTLEQMP